MTADLTHAADAILDRVTTGGPRVPGVVDGYLDFETAVYESVGT